MKRGDGCGRASETSQRTSHATCVEYGHRLAWTALQAAHEITVICPFVPVANKWPTLRDPFNLRGKVPRASCIGFPDYRNHKRFSSRLLTTPPIGQNFNSLGHSLKCLEVSHPVSTLLRLFVSLVPNIRCVETPVVAIKEGGSLEHPTPIQFQRQPNRLLQPDRAILP